MIRAGILFLVALVASVLTYPAAIGWLARARIAQVILEEAPSSHRGKAGTPTAGGLLVILIGAVLFVAADRSREGALVALALLLGGAVGFADDYLAVRGGTNLGLRARDKIVLQLLTGGILAGLAWRWGFDRQLVPFAGVKPLGVWLVLVGAVAFVAGSNAFNLTDGSDGLAGGAGAITFGTLAITALLQRHPPGAFMSATLAGALLGFLVYNYFPARIFMGDTGSMGLGTAMVAAAIVSGFLWYLPLLAVTFVLETVSVIAQLTSVKLTGRRIFRASPLHHHFHEIGWREPRVALWSWAIGLVASIVTLVIARPGAAGL